MSGSGDRSVLTWTISDVRSWLTDQGMARYAKVFCDQHRIDGPALLMIQEQDLRQPPLQLEVLGDIKRLVYQISALKYNLVYPDQITKYCLTHHHHGSSSQAAGGQSLVREQSPAKWSDTLDISSSDESSSGREPTKRISGLVSSPSGAVQSPCNNCRTVNGFKSNLASNPLPERWKLAIAMFYGMFVSWLTAFVMTIVHDRVPDMNKYPPLPDIILDNVPHIPWAFEMAEISGMTLLTIWIVIIIFHKHRFIIARRCFAIGGTIFLLRCFTMLITSLSVPGVHLDCKPRPYGTWASRLHEAYIIWSGAGMSLQGVRTCGDYMFSGHTVSLTLLNFFITEYTSRRIFFLHTFTWLCNCFGIFFILAAHEHYSIDVFIAFYITSRLFLYYHTLVNNRAVFKSQEVKTSFDAKRTWFYFPLFSFFEQNIDGRIPNEFELPISPQDVRNIVKKIGDSFKNKFEDCTSNSMDNKKLMKKRR